MILRPQTGRRLLLLLALVPLMVSCTTTKQWTHSGKTKDAFYRDDAKCLKESNQVLFEQLQEISPQDSSNNNVCILPDAGKRIHQACMKELGWQLE